MAKIIKKSSGACNTDYPSYDYENRPPVNCSRASGIAEQDFERDYQQKITECERRRQWTGYENIMSLAGSFNKKGDSDE
jgi:hypothetical protein